MNEKKMTIVDKMKEARRQRNITDIPGLKPKTEQLKEKHGTFDDSEEPRFLSRIIYVKEANDKQSKNYLKKNENDKQMSMKIFPFNFKSNWHVGKFSVRVKDQSTMTDQDILPFDNICKSMEPIFSHSVIEKSPKIECNSEIKNPWGDESMHHFVSWITSGNKKDFGKANEILFNEKLYQ